MTDGIGKHFMQRTRYQHMGPSDQQKGLPAPPLELDFDQARPAIALPDPAALAAEKVVLRELIENRRSVRRYAKTPLALAELSYLLWCTQGVREVARGAATFRTVPSAGARHAFETYLLVNNVDGLAGGLYRYLATRHELMEISRDPAIATKVTDACFGQDFVRTGAVTFLWAAVAYRMTWRYGQRGYRYMHLDAGHVCQNLYIAGESIGCGVCAIAAFDDEALNATLGIDGEGHFVIYLAALGKKVGE